MRLGYLTKYSPEEVARADEIGFDGLELQASSWEDLTDLTQAEEAADVLDEYDVAATCLAAYKAGPIEDVKATIAHYKDVIGFAEALGVPVVAMMTGGDRTQGPDEALTAWTAVFKEIAQVAEDAGIKIAFENWPAVWGPFPMGSNNFGHTPEQWERMFEAVPSDALGLEFDPSHLVWQQIDYLDALYHFRDRIYHVHAKDTEIVPSVLAKVGIFGSGWWRYRIPGLGIVDWSAFLSALYEIGYDGGVAIEHEDPVFTGERFEMGLVLGYNTLAPLIQI